MFFVTRQKDNAAYEPLEEFDISPDTDPGVIQDECISLEKDDQTLLLRRIAYYHADQDRTYVFITNNYELQADKIAGIYKQRWQIETMFKRLKQSFPLKYFLETIKMP